MTTLDVDPLSGLPSLEFVLPAGRGEITPRTYTFMIDQLMYMIDEVDRLALPGTPLLDWRMADASMNGRTRVLVRPSVVPQGRDLLSVGVAAFNVVRGLRGLTAAAEVPTEFTERTVGRVQKLGNRLTREKLGVAQVSALVAGRRVPMRANVNSKTTENAAKAVKAAIVAHGSLIGRLDALGRTDSKGSIHCALRDERSKVAVVVVAREEHRQQLRELWGDRVLIVGRLTRNAAGQPIRIDVNTIEPAIKLPPIPASEILGIAPNWTGKLTTEEFVREARHG